MEKVIWSSTDDRDYVLGLSGDEKKAAVKSILGVDDDMVDNMSDDDLDRIISKDLTYSEDGADKFYKSVLPMLERDTAYGIIVAAGINGNKDVYAFRASDILEENDGEDIKLVDRNGEVVLINGYGEYKLYNIPTSNDEKIEFVRNVMPELLETTGDDFLDWDFEENFSIDDYLSDTDELSNWLDHDALINFGAPIINTISNNIVTEAKAKQPEELEIELADLEADLEDFGPDGFYAVSLDRFSRQYPEFTTYVIKTFLKEMQILTKEELEDMSTLDDYWRNGELILDNDWDCLIEGAHKLANGESVQWEKLYKKYYRPTDSE